MEIYKEPEVEPQITVRQNELTTAKHLPKPDSLTTIDAVPARKGQRQLTTKPSQPSSGVKEVNMVSHKTLSSTATNAQPAQNQERPAVESSVNEVNMVSHKTVISVAANDQPVQRQERLVVNSSAAEKPEVSGKNAPPQLMETMDKGFTATRSTTPGTKNGGIPARSGGDGSYIFIDTDLTEVDEHPVEIDCPRPEYPSKAKQNNWEGTVLLQGEIKVNGRVGKVKVVKSSSYDVLDQQALSFFKCWRYQPAKKEGKPVICLKRISFVFKLGD